MRIVITGSCGFIGSALTARHVAAGDEVTGIDSYDHYYSREVKKGNWEWATRSGGRGARFHEIDVAEFGPLSKVLAAEKPEVLVHLAAKAGVLDSEVNPEAFCRANILGTANVLEACERAGINNVVLASSSSVYGGDRDGPMNEKDRTAPKSVYATTKLATEVLAAGYAGRIKGGLRCLRFFTVYGPRQRPDMGFMKFLRAIKTGGTIRIRGRGMRRDFSFIDDIIDGIMAAEANNVHGYECFNLGSSRPHEVEAVVKMLFSITGQSCHTEIVEPNQIEARCTYADIAWAKQRLGFEPRTTLEEGLRAQYAWYKEAIS